MHHQPVIHLLVHLHLLVAGYLFTIAMISVDPLPHRRSYLHRAIVLILGTGRPRHLGQVPVRPPTGRGRRFGGRGRRRCSCTTEGTQWKS